MSQARAFCRRLQVLGRGQLPALARTFLARKSRCSLAYTFPDGSVVRFTDRCIVEAATIVREKYWIPAE